MIEEEAGGGVSAIAVLCVDLSTFWRDGVDGAEDETQLIHRVVRVQQLGILSSRHERDNKKKERKEEQECDNEDEDGGAGGRSARSGAPVCRRARGEERGAEAVSRGGRVGRR